MAKEGGGGFISAVLQGFYIGGHLMQPALVLMAASRLDAALEGALLAKMRQMGEREKRRIFDGRGPL